MECGDNCEDPYDTIHAELKDWVVSCWNGTSTSSLNKVCLEIANKYKSQVGGSSADWTYFAMVIKKQAYEFDTKFVDDPALYYCEYSISDDYYCICIEKLYDKNPKQNVAVDRLR